jgi:hypothetical protein
MLKIIGAGMLCLLVIAIGNYGLSKEHMAFSRAAGEACKEQPTPAAKAQCAAALFNGRAEKHDIAFQDRDNILQLLVGETPVRLQIQRVVDCTKTTEETCSTAYTFTPMP